MNNIKFYICIIICAIIYFFIFINSSENSEIQEKNYQNIIDIKRKNIISVNTLISESMTDDIITNVEFRKICQEYKNVIKIKNKNELKNEKNYE